jgi:ABC-type multidrug transport system fused ATPase/permease subunit
MQQVEPQTPGLVRRFFTECVRPYIGLQIEIVVCLLAGVVLNLVDPILLKAILDRALGDGDARLLLVLILVLGVVLLFRVAFRLVSVWLYSYGGLRILFDFRRRAYEHVQRLSPYFFRGERTGDILARLTSDIDVLQQTAAHTIVNAAQDVLTIVGILAMLLWLDPSLTLGLILVYPVLIFLLVRINQRLEREGFRAREAVSGLFSFLEERVSGVRLVQEYRQERIQARRHVQLSRPWMSSYLNMSFVSAGQVSLADTMTTGAFILVFLWGGHRVLGGTLSLGSLVAFYTLATRLYRPITGLIDINIDIQIARASLARVYQILDHEPEIREAPNATAPKHPRGALCLDSLSLTWPDGTCVLQDVSLAVLPGQRVAIVGPSGSGKSTLAAVIARYLDPSVGSVTIDGLDVRRWKLAALRRNVGLVAQETELFHDTLAENLRMAKPRASDAELMNAVETGGLDELVRSMPEGLKTLVGSEGMRLSGGERQRVALARALLKQPTLYILDEATSALDPRTERQVLGRFMESVGRATVMVIAHRLTSLVGMDTIFVLHMGRLVESGTHGELYAAGGLYRELYDEQIREGDGSVRV